MKTFTFRQLRNISKTHLDKIIANSKDKTELLFNLAGFYGYICQKLKENEKTKIQNLG